MNVLPSVRFIPFVQKKLVEIDAIRNTGMSKCCACADSINFESKLSFGTGECVNNSSILNQFCLTPPETLKKQAQRNDKGSRV